MTISLRSLIEQPDLQSLSERLQKSSHILVESLWDSAKALILATLQRHTDKSILVITGEHESSSLVDNFPFFGIKTYTEFPAWDTLPSEDLPPSTDIIGKRLHALHTLLHSRDSQIVLTPLQSALQKLPSKKHIEQNCFFWKKGTEIPFDIIADFLTDLGYRRQSVVRERGTFALRGGIIDIFPTATPLPYRIEFSDDTIYSIRSFDPGEQRSIEHIENFFLSAVHESQLLKKTQEEFTLFNYLPTDPIIVFDDVVALEDKYALLKKSIENHPDTLSFSSLWEKSKQFPCILYSPEPLSLINPIETSLKLETNYPLEIFSHTIQVEKWESPFSSIQEYAENLLSSTEESKPLLDAYLQSSLDLICTTTSTHETAFLQERLNQTAPSKKNVFFEHGYLSTGFVLGNTACLPSGLIFGTHPIRKKQLTTTVSHAAPEQLHALTPGDYVVHTQNGIAKYLGIETQRNHLQETSEFLVLEYAQGSKFYVPMASSHLVSKYIGVHESTPTLHQLGTKKWQKIRENTEQSVVGYAEELLKLHAQRDVVGGFAFPPDGTELVEFENDFPFTTTADQQKAIDATKADMMSPTAMDRLICGDVGYGKTEVAMRAAFKAVCDGKKQVAILVPTTMLAMQHYENFSSRMNQYELSVEVISRFISPKKVKEILTLCSLGKVDILIGTHRLLSNDVKFDNLGLLIIDEEQRFGVRAKESIKKYKIGIDCLTLSATPIPRTLYMSLIGIRDISTINTPPHERLPIKSIIAERNWDLIKNACLRELTREGQIYFIHNRIDSIEKIANELKSVLPQAKILVGHGQMTSQQLDAVYHSFKQGLADVLVATTIVENGVDIPNANTILIDYAHTFGLGTLYQLRGRVGRWDRPAYAYFLTTKNVQLAELQEKRLGVLLETSGYGGGMAIAMRDLELRGAGDLLGTKQSGQVSAVGFHLYCSLLRQAVAAVKAQRQPIFTETRVESLFSAAIPDTYVIEPELRRELYYRLGGIQSLKEAELFLQELIDRFGPPPLPLQWLYHMTRIKIRATKERYISIRFEKFTMTVEKAKGGQTVKSTLPLPQTAVPDQFEKAIAVLLFTQ